MSDDTIEPTDRARRGLSEADLQRLLAEAEQREARRIRPLAGDARPQPWWRPLHLGVVCRDCWRIRRLCGAPISIFVYGPVRRELVVLRELDLPAHRVGPPRPGPGAGP